MREQFRAQMTAELNITPEQKAQIDAIRERNDGDWGAMREEIDAVLTPEQRERAEAMREERFGRMRERMMEDAQVLDPEQRERFEQRLEERRQQWEERRGGGPRPNEFGTGART
jgi:Spy/CpxP family protein refolding chaperone